jgi:Ni/Fe-hydrogenase subunit HybB-like protein
MSTTAQIVPGPIVTRPFKVLAVLAGLGAAMAAWRFAAGLGATTGLSDGYPWGIWIAIDVVTGTALACGGYAIAILAYVLNKGRYHPLVRPAILTSALGYSTAGLMIAVDVGRPWFIYRIPLRFWSWNLHSALLEVALCVMAYVVVLWIELSPAILETWQHSPRPTLRRIASVARPRLEKALIWIIALGLLLPTMHQSSLGTLMLLTGPKLHPLWNTPLLPLLFLLACVAMGYGVVVFEATLSSVAYRRRLEMPMLASLSGVMAGVLLAFTALRLLDLGLRGRLGLAFTGSGRGLVFLVETLLFVVPAVMLLDTRRRGRPGHLFRAALLVVLAGTVYRFDTYLVGFVPGPGWYYFPTVPEILVTVGVVSAEIMAWLALVKTFPILGGAPALPARENA